MNKKEKFQSILDWFGTYMPEPQTELNFKSPFELLVAVVLSAQCTDKRVNIVTEKLFSVFPDAYSMSNASHEEIFELIKSISYPNNKTKHLVGLSRLLQEKYAGEVPLHVEELQKLPGVGRKTANVIVSVLDQQPAMAVDTHVYRVAHRLGLVTKTAKTPLEVERQLTKHIPSKLIHKAHHWLILHGRYTCLARNPKCESCSFCSFCTYTKRPK